MPSEWFYHRILSRSPASVRRARLDRLIRVAVLLGIALGFHVLFQILAAFRGYFPADLTDSVFLSAHRGHFDGWYALAFYAHIISAPLSWLLGLALVLSGVWGTRPPRLHRYVGRVQAMLVLLFVVPSGLVMSRFAIAGPIASVAFTILSMATAGTIIVSVRFAVIGHIALHRRWAMRCFILLCSPLLLRVAVGVTIVADAESTTAHRVLAWASWLVPLLLFEIGRKCHELALERKTTASRMPTAALHSEPLST